MNGTASTSADDETILEYELAKGGSYVCTIATGKYVAA